MQYKVKAISAMEKVMLRDTFDTYAPIKKVRGLRGERVSFQIQMGYFPTEGVKTRRALAHYTFRSSLKKNTQISLVEQVPSTLPAYNDEDTDYITTKPGLFPDPLIPLKAKEVFYAHHTTPTVLMVTVDIPEDLPAGEYPLCFTFHYISHSGVELAKTNRLKVTVQVEDLIIKKNDLVFTQWFHCDSIATYHQVKMMSERHWKLIENYTKTAARTGITMLLTPIFTPALDTSIGGGRPTMQLVKIKKEGDTYSFDFTLLKRWIDICHKYGIEYFEMAHLFTQWGVAFCPKIVVEIDGKQVKEFGWHVEAMSDAYKNFLSQFLPALTAELKKLGVADKTYFHISDEPNETHYENYLAAKTFVQPYLKGFKIMDALSRIEFYTNGLIEYPVCATDHIEPFMEADIPERWCYYCCSQGNLVGNRFFAMPSYRNRILGVQMFLADMYGFLQWGYNFYYTARAMFPIDPYAVTDGRQAWPSGDPFSVYPHKDGAIESIRTVVFYQAIQDRSLLQMLADKIGLKETKKWVEEQAGMTINFKEYPRNKEFLENLHDAIIDRLLEV